MMKHLRVVLGLVFLLVLVVPLTASAQGGITYDTGIQVQNLDASNEANVVITFYNQDGTEAASVSDIIPAGGAVTYYPLNAVSSGFNGSVVISSDRDIRAIANVLGNGSNLGASYGAFTAGATTVSIPLLMKENSGYNTWFNVQNTGSSVTDVTVTYSDGEVETCTGLQPGASCTLDQSTEGHVAGWVGSATVTASEPLAATIMEIGPTTLFAYSGFTGGTTEIAMPLINANNSGYITGVQIQNMGSVDTDVTVSYTPSSAGTACTETQTVQAGKSATFALNAFTASGSCGAQTFVGSAKVTANSANQDLVAIVNQLNGAANKGAAYEAFDPVNATDTVVMPLIMDRNSNYFTGFSVLNVGSSATTVSCSFTGSAHTEGATLQVGEALTPIQKDQIGDGYVGSATCTATSGGKIVGIVNELNSVSSGDAFLVYDAFNQ